MKVWAEIEVQGIEAHRNGVPKSRNPYQYCSLKNHGPAKAGAWAKGWGTLRVNENSSLKTKKRAISYVEVVRR